MADKLTMSRRAFVKTSAAAAAAAAFATNSVSHLEETDQAWADSDDEYETIWTYCHACITNCPVVAYMRNGRLIKVEGRPDAPINRGSLCVKGLSAPQALYHPNRIKYPMKRVGERGGNEWERMSWDEAIDYVAKKLYGIYEQYGPEALFGSAGGGGSPSLSTVHMVLKSMGSPNQFEPGCAQCFMPRQTEGRLAMNLDHISFADDACSEVMNPNSGQTTMVWWGTCPAYDQTGKGNLKSIDLFERGCKIIVVDPRFTPTAARADIWLPIRAGSDVALILSWYKYIIEEKKYDEEFDKYWTNLPFICNPETKLPIEAQEVFEEFDNPTGEPCFICWDELTQSVQPLAYDDPDRVPVDPALFKTGIQVTLLDGTVLEGCQTAFQYFYDASKDYTFEKAAELCWLDADQIKTACEWYCEPRAGLSAGVALEQNPQSNQSTMGLLSMELMMGHVGGPGNTISSGVPRTPGRQARFTASKDAGYMIDPAFQYGQALVGGHNGFCAWAMCHIPSLLKAIETGDPYQPRAWFDFSGNKLAMLGDVRRWYNARDKLDFCVGYYMYPTSWHIEFADVVFPCTEWTETILWEHRFTQIGVSYLRRPVTHLFEDVDHIVMAGQVVKRMAELGHEGCQKNFARGIFLTSAEEQREYAMKQGRTNMTWDEYCEKQKEIEYRSPEQIEEAYNKFWTYYGYKMDVDGYPMGFGTYTRKCEPYADIMIKCGHNGYPFTDVMPDAKDILGEDFSAVPYFREQDESPYNEEIAKEYPLVYSGGRLPFYHHGTLRNIPFLREIFPVAGCFINTDTAASLGIKDQDWVKVSSKRGSIYARAYTTEGINPGEVYQERFWNPECYDPANKKGYSGGWEEMNINVLTKIDGYNNPEWGSCNYRAFMVKVEKVDSIPDYIWTQPKDFTPWLPQPTDATPEVY